jgi:hypothetical protein
VLVTDHKNYGAAKRGVWLSLDHRQPRSPKNPAENSQTTEFKSPRAPTSVVDDDLDRQAAEDPACSIALNEIDRPPRTVQHLVGQSHEQAEHGLPQRQP